MHSDTLTAGKLPFVLMRLDTGRTQPNDTPKTLRLIRLKFDLVPTPIRTGRIVDAAGQPVNEARIWISLPQDSFIISHAGDYFGDLESPTAKSDQNGQFRYGTPINNHAIVAVKGRYAEKYLVARRNPRG